jgi:ketosteroid isomerase-like protein
VSVPEAIGRYFNGVNTEDWDDFRGIWHDDAVVEVVGGVRVQGWDEIRPYYVRALAGFPAHHDDPYRIHVAGDTVTVEIAFTGETVEGVPTSFEAVDVFTLADGRITRLTTWYDLGRVLGFLRTPGTPEMRLRTLVRHAAASSPHYRRRFEELGLGPEAVADDLSLLPETRLDEIAPAELVAVADREITQVVASSNGAVPLGRADVAERGRLWEAALALAGAGPGDTVFAAEPAPGLAEGVARRRARLAFATDPATAGATVVVHPATGTAPPLPEGARSVTVVALPETGIIASSCTAGTLHAHTESHVVEIAGGRLVVTPLGARAMPLLRLVTGIEAAWLGNACACGSDLPGLTVQEAPPA